MKITQNHFDVILDLSGDGSAEEAVVDEIAQRINEYIELEDISADYSIGFSKGDAFSVVRDGYTFDVTLESTTTPDDVLDAIAGDLVEIFDEMDSDYDDDVYELRFGMEIDSSRTSAPRTPPPPRSPGPEPEEESGFSDDVEEFESADDMNVYEVAIADDLVGMDSDYDDDDLLRTLLTQRFDDIRRVKDMLEKSEDLCGLLGFEAGEPINFYALISRLSYKVYFLRVYDFIRSTCKLDKRAISPDEMRLLDVSIWLNSLGLDEQLRLIEPQQGEQWQPEVMDSLHPSRKTRIDVCLVPSVQIRSKVVRKALVLLQQDPELGGHTQDYVLDDMRDDQGGSMRRESSKLEADGDLLRTLLTQRFDDIIRVYDMLEKSEELCQRLRFETGEPINFYALIIRLSYKVYLFRIYDFIRSTCKRDKRAISPEERQLLDVSIWLNSLGTGEQFRLIEPQQGEQWQPNVMDFLYPSSNTLIDVCLVPSLQSGKTVERRGLVLLQPPKTRN